MVTPMLSFPFTQSKVIQSALSSPVRVSVLESLWVSSLYPADGEFRSGPDQLNAEWSCWMGIGRPKPTSAT